MSRMYNTNSLNTSFGHLKIGAFADSIGRPINNAVITVMPHGNEKGNNRTSEELITDSFGQSPVINLAAPPIDFSLDEFSDRKPYSEYDLEVIADGFEPARIEGVQILPETTAIQDVILNDLSNRTQNSEELIKIGEHTLYEAYPPKIPEEEVKELPPSQGFVVLSEPVIPEYIVVHTGMPNDSSAANYWVPFKDYIKIKSRRTKSRL